jgi:hypothetical protein
MMYQTNCSVAMTMDFKLHARGSDSSILSSLDVDAQSNFALFSRDVPADSKAELAVDRPVVLSLVKF